MNEETRTPLTIVAGQPLGAPVPQDAPPDQVFEAWYAKRMSADIDALRNGRSLATQTLAATHVHLANVIARDREEVYWAMQGEIWSPTGQARPLMEKLGIHTTMCCGDVVREPNGSYWQCVFDGWKEVQDEPKHVVVLPDDVDRHDPGCHCGLCNAAGHAHGAGVYELPPDCRDLEQLSEDEWTNLQTQDVLLREYGPLEETAIYNATMEAEAEGWIVLNKQPFL